MKTMFDEYVRMELIDRISLLHVSSPRQWGKMNLYQMTKHCTAWDEWVLGTNQQTYSQSFLGMIFGKLALRSEVWADKPMRKGMPAGNLLTVREADGDVELQKTKWIQRVGEYGSFSNTNFVHDFWQDDERRDRYISLQACRSSFSAVQCLSRAMRSRMTGFVWTH